MGPSAMRIAGLVERLRDLGIEVTDRGNVPVSQPESRQARNERARFLPEIEHCCARLRARVEYFQKRIGKLDIKEDQDDVRTCLVGFQTEFNRFVKDPSYKTMRMVDRRSFASVLGQLSELLEDESLKARSVELTVEGLSKFLDSLSLMNQRELLVIHDRDAVQDTQLQLERIRQAVADHPFAFEGQSYRVTVSAGVGGTDGARPVSSESLLARADEMLYQSKRTGRNAVSF